MCPSVKAIGCRVATLITWKKTNKQAVKLINKGKATCHLIYIFLISVWGKPALPIWITFEILPRTQSHPHIFLSSWYCSCKGFFSLCLITLQKYTKACFTVHAWKSTLAPVWSSAKCTLCSFDGVSMPRYTSLRQGI